MKTPIALTIAGSDSSGGAGIQADLKTFSALGVYGASAVTAVTAQNTRAVTAVQTLDPDTVAAQIHAVLADLSVGAVKIGMLFSSAVIETVAAALDAYDGPIVLDPVMIAKSGDPLLKPDAVDALRTHLFPRATLLTPNRPEAAALLNTKPTDDPDTLCEQGRALQALGPAAVLMKGGHADGAVCTDWLVADRVVRFDAPRIATGNTHGTGCTLSSAVAAGLACGLALPAAVKQAHAYLYGAIEAADRLHIGSGHGPVHHFYQQWTRPE